tara:strand:- start:283 stop:3162 length:2880 start_codon:yes stop_codon:yes gene_type:complete
MTLIPDERLYTAVGRQIGNSEIESDFTPEIGEVVQAAFSTENVLGSWIVKEKGLPDGYIHNEEFNPFDQLTEQEKDDPLFSKNAMLADTTEELNAFRRQYANETKNRELLRDAGALGAVATFGAALADPINLIPVGGVAYKTYKGGHSILAGAMATASTAVGITAVTEAGLHATQLQRTYGESAVNMTGAFLLGGALGAAAAKFATPKLEEEIISAMDVEPKLARGQDSVGAMSAIQDVQITGKVAKGLAKILGWDPLSRTLTSTNPFTRALSAKLAESPYLLDGENLTAVQSRVKVNTAERYNPAFMAHIDQFEQYRKTGGKLKRRDFNKLVSREQRDPGSVDNIHVKNSAKEWEAGTYEPLRGEAIEAKLLPEDITPSNAAQYLNRQWLPENIAANLPLFLQKTEQWLKSQNLDADIDIPDLAGQISRRLMTQRDGMLPYDYDVLTEVLKPIKGAKGTLSSSFKELSFQVNSRDFEDFIENDIEILARNYVRRTVPDIEFTKAFDGDLTMSSEIGDMQNWYTKQIKEAKTEKERIKLQKQMSTDKRDLEAMNERIRGVYQGGASVIDPESIFGRMMKVSRDLNYMRFMGGVVPASFSDVARITMSEGLVKTFSKGLIPMIANIKKFKVAAAEGKAWGIGDDMITGNRVDVLADIQDYSRGQTALERGVHSAAQSFSKINLMNQWTSSMKQLQSVVMQNEIVPNMIKGKTDKRLVRLGISNDNQLNIGRELKKHGTEDGGFWIANVGKWDNPELGMMYKTAMRKESDRVIVVPGEEKPLFMSSEMGKTLFQFRSFMMAATQRVLISSIQGQDANFMAGMAAMVTMGMTTYAFKQWDAGRELSDDPAVWIAEGLDRSGATGSIMEINNTLEKISSNSLGIRPLLGITTPASRFASRNQSEAFLGPTFGSLLSTTLRVAGSASSDYEWTDSDTRAMRRLIPYQNLAIFRQGIDKMEEAIQ